MLRGVLLLCVLLHPLAAEAWRGRVARLGRSILVRQMYYELKLGKYKLQGVALPAKHERFYQNKRQELLADFYFDMLVHYYDDEGRSAIGIAQYFNATNMNKIRIKDPFNSASSDIIDVSQISGVLIAGHDHQHRAVNFDNTAGQVLNLASPLPEQANLLYGKVEVVFSDGYRVVVANAFEQRDAHNPSDLQGVYVFLVEAKNITFAEDTRG